MKYLIPYPEGFCEDRKYPLILFPELGHNCWETVYSDENATAAQADYTTWLDGVFAEGEAKFQAENVVFTAHAEKE